MLISDQVASACSLLCSTVPLWCQATHVWVGGWCVSTLPGNGFEGHLWTISLHDLLSPTVAQAGPYLFLLMLQKSPGLFLPLL